MKTLILAFICFSLVACSGDTPQTDNTNTDATAAANTDNPISEAENAPAIELSQKMVEASCGQCNFGLAGNSCDLAIRVDGKAYFEEIRAGLVIQFKMGNKTSAEIFEIESKLENTTSKIIKGDWMTAQYHLSLVASGGALEQSLLDEVGGYIANYINENY